jgi:hypothetical protein
MSRPYILDHERPKTTAELIEEMVRPKTLDEYWREFVEEQGRLPDAAMALEMARALIPIRLFLLLTRLGA